MEFKFWKRSVITDRRRAALILALLAPAIVCAQKIAQSESRGAGTAETRAAKSFDAARGNPLALYAFLVRMPKGADLHNHLSGAVYAESWIRAGTEDHLCVDLKTFSFSKPHSGLIGVDGNPDCGEDKAAVASSLRNQSLYDSMIDAFSMRAFVFSSGESGHDHFFNAFAKFDVVEKTHVGEWIDEVATRAADQNEQYLELMLTPPSRHAVALANSIPWTDDFAQLRSEFLTQGIRDDAAVAKDYLDEAEALRRKREHCGEANEVAACHVEIRYLYQVARAAKKEHVFAQTLLGFELTSADPRFVGINYVQPEDNYTAMADYDLHMRIVGFMHREYPGAHISLHAGELAFGLVPPEDLCCHIREAVEVAHAERIGHGVDILYETGHADLLKKMADSHVMVEINLTSNDVILGVSGKNHPFMTYRQNKVPVALSTDDEGVSRINLTHEYVRAAETYGLGYQDLKQMVRTSLEHSFLPGKSLWHRSDEFTILVSECSSDTSGSEKHSNACSAFLKSNEKARQQWELERRFAAFESTF
jgi:adenosine deaminase